jgi:hypothetical protein
LSTIQILRGDRVNWSHLRKSWNKRKNISHILITDVLTNNWIFIPTINILFLSIKTIGYDTQEEFQRSAFTTIALPYGEMRTTCYADWERMKFNKSVVSMKILCMSNLILHSNHIACTVVRNKNLYHMIKDENLYCIKQ